METIEPQLKGGYRWDVAISLLSEDEPYANRLRDELAVHVRGEVFLYSRKQEVVAQVGGMVELFTRVFRSEARVVVIVHRKRWGESGYTAVEQDALRARYVKEGARRIIVVCMDGTYPSGWYPADFFRPDANQFSLSQIAAVVASRVQELGGLLGPEHPVDKARRLKGERAKEELLDGQLEALGPAVIEEEARRLFDHLRALADQVSKGSDQSMSYDERGRACRVNHRWGSLVCQWHRQVANSMEGVELTINILDANIQFSGTRLSEPRTLLGATFDVSHPEEGLWGWKARPVKPARRIAPFLTTAELGTWATNELLEATKGDPPRRPLPPRRQGPGWVDSWRYR